jgi:hypothetical protein
MSTKQQNAASSFPASRMRKTWGPYTVKCVLLVTKRVVNGVYDPNREYGRLSRETWVDPIYYHLNIKKKLSWIFLNQTILFTGCVELSFDLPSRLGHVRITLTQVNIKLKLGNKLDQEILKLNCWVKLFYPFYFLF